MNFKQYLNEQEEIPAEQEQTPVSTEIADEPDESGEELFDSVNESLYEAFRENVVTPQAGFQIVRDVMESYNFEIPMVFDLDDEDGEQIFVLDMEDSFLYVLYSINESGYYDFHAEMTDGDGLEDILSEEDLVEE
jgi:hypothetical protein